MREAFEVSCTGSCPIYGEDPCFVSSKKKKHKASGLFFSPQPSLSPPLIMMEPYSTVRKGRSLSGAIQSKSSASSFSSSTV